MITVHKPTTREVVSSVVSGLLFRWPSDGETDFEPGKFWRQWVGAHVYYYSCAHLADIDGHVAAAYQPRNLLLVEHDGGHYEWVPADQIAVIMSKAPKK